MNELDIKDLLNQYSKTLEYIKSKKLYSKWIKYKKNTIQADRKTIPIEQFQKIETDYYIEFPEDIKFFHINIGNKDTDFHNQIERMLKGKDQGLIEYHYSNNFAQKIAETYLSKTAKEKQKIKNEINHESLKAYQTILEFFLWEGLEFYDKKSNTFSLSFLQDIYENLKSDKDLIIENFFTWCHCGGAGGIILNTNRKGFDSGEQWGDGLEIKHNGHYYTYKSNFNQKFYDLHYLESYIEIIKTELKELENFSKKRKLFF